MFSRWSQHLKTDFEKEQFRSEVQGSKVVLQRQAQILQELEQEIDRVETNPKTYEIPNWDYRQAHNNGFRQCLNIIQKLIDLDQKEPNDRQSIRPTGPGN